MFVKTINGEILSGEMTGRVFVTVDGMKVTKDMLVSELFKTHGGYLEVPMVI